ncbi:MAG: hypothetical protein GX950_02125 [Candidatus Diapherotrites archaeon]|uniref:Uncharacterized protein n=1 Tax=Candidatus Iainarchaeum sp. TaxID=3101447 RepID=A0A7K4BZA2_9ARCH|nr:hypothetical protein [Candidatus Diapherotrites archaeon]
MKGERFGVVQVNESTLREYYKFYTSNLDANTKARKNFGTFERQLKNGYKFFFVVGKGGEKVGTFALFKNPATTKLFWRVPFFSKTSLDFAGLSVAKKYQHKTLSNKYSLGSGKILLGVINAAESKAKEMGAKKLNVLIERTNPNWRQSSLGGGINSKGGYKRNRTLTTKMALARWYQKKIKKRSIPKLTVLTKNLTKNKAKRK